MKIIADDREWRSGVIEELRSHPKVTVPLVRLPIGEGYMLKQKIIW
tara:strand:- start:301 stop:438 length:138 start_codon:yes stop_codon:yes gene_type:complete